MFVVTNREMRDIDRYTIADIGIPSLVLMENAGKAVADWIGKQYDKKCKWEWYVGKGTDIAVQYRIARNIGLPMQCLYSEEELSLGNDITTFDIFVDAILGTGSRGELRALYKNVVRAINNEKSNNNVKVISVDNPTGVIGDHGEMATDAINADVTLTLGYMKQSLITYPAAGCTGEVIVLDIGIPKCIEQQHKLSKQLLTEECIRHWFPKRVSNSNKGTYGKVRCITGSDAYPGAGYLAATACLHIGAGLAFWDAPEGVAEKWCGQTPELIAVSHPSEAGHFAFESIESLFEATRAADAVVVGCSIGQFSQGEDWIEELVNRIECPIVIDADAYAMLRNRFSKLKKRKNMIVTPHPGEFAKVLGISIAELEKKRIDLSMDFAKEHQVTLVLKGSHTTIATPDGRLYINASANHVLAKGGTGDVLAGFMGGLLAQGVTSEHAACVAVFCHSLAAQQLAEKKYVSTMASDVSRNVGAIMQKIANHV